MKTYKHLSLDEREDLLALKAQGRSLRTIAGLLNRSPSSLSREFKRNRIPGRPGPFYRPAKAHWKARFRLKQLHRRPSRFDNNPALEALVVQGLRERWSPELIAGRLQRQYGKPLVSHESIYRWIYSEARQWIPFLLRSHPKRWRRSSRSWIKRLIEKRVSIHERPEEINHRDHPGHWETDLLWGQGKAVLQVLVERQTRFTRLKRLPNKTAQASFDALSVLFSRVPMPLRRSITYDNGVENFLHDHLNRIFGLRSYFCDPFHAWQKGTVENTNGLLRRFLPTQTNFDILPLTELKKLEDWLNDRPRKCLRFQTPAEAYRAAVALAT